MIEFNPARCKIKPFKHQVDGIKALLRNKSFALFDEPGAGKSAQGINAACTLADAGDISTVVVVSPASVRCVWIDENIGEIKKHSWIPSAVFEFHAKTRLVWADKEKAEIVWISCNYEFLRGEKHLRDLLDLVRGRKVMLICDESSFVKTRSAKQTKAVMKLREACTRCVIYSGTPVTDSPLDLWSQLKVLDPTILGKRYANYYHFRANYAVMGGFKMKQVTKFVNLDKLSKIVAPHVLRRLKADCLDLPPKLYTIREVALTPESWRRYKELRRDALITLSAEDVRLEPNAAVRVMRLAQLTSGILGGNYVKSDGDFVIESETQDLSSEKLDWCVKYLTEECTAKAVIVWCRWRRERERLVKELSGTSGSWAIGFAELYGGQPKAEREDAVRIFSAPIHTIGKPWVLVAQPHAGGHGLNLVAATECIYLSNDFSLGIRLQSEDRCHRPGQEHPVLYIDCVAVGPQGQPTIDSHIVKALREKKNLADFTTSQWRKVLSDE